MGYQIISVTNNGVDTKVLGISYKSATGIFQPLYTTMDQSVENLKTLLLTRVGERYGQPEYGTFLLNAIFEPNVVDLKDQIKDFITPKVSTFLPYIDIQDITVVTAEDDPTLNYNIQITITFSVANFDTRSVTISASENGALEVTNT
jgi:phage baseplate assembly protein W